MKTALKSLLATIHLAPLSQVEHLDDLAGRAAVPMSELKERMAKLGADVELHALRERLGHANHVTTIAREHLLATEVKFDLIEAAILVLDTRTRETAVRP
jgi:hypothetical protein